MPRAGGLAARGAGCHFRRMKVLLPGVLILASWLAWPAGAAAADEAAKTDEEKPVHWNVTAECQMVVLPQKAALALLPDLNDDAKIESAYARLQAMIEKGEAQLAANLLTKGASGERSHAEAVEEVRYGANFDPPQLPDKIPAEKPVETMKAWPFVAATPTGFEKRDVGTTIEVVGRVADDGRHIDITAIASHVRFLRWKKFEIGVMPTGQHITIEQPCFHELTNTNSLRERNGQRVLIGFHKLPEPAATFELILLRVSAKKAD